MNAIRRSAPRAFRTPPRASHSLWPSFSSSNWPPCPRAFWHINVKPWMTSWRSALPSFAPTVPSAACTSVMNTHMAVHFRNAKEAVCPVCHCHSPAIPLLTHIWRSASATHFAEEAAWPVGACTYTCMAFRFRNSVCRGGRVTCLPLPFACNSVINTYKAFRFLNSLCGGGRVTCLLLPFACISVINTHKALRFHNSLSWTSPSAPALAAWPIHSSRSL